MDNVPVWEVGWDKKIDIPMAINCLKDIADTYAQMGVRWCLGFGSLLGAVRDGGPIPWDDDIDIVLFQGERERIKAANIILRDDGFYVPEEGMPTWDEVYIRDGQKIEGWVMKNDGTHYWYDTRQPNVRYEKRFFDELTNMAFGGIVVPVPVDARELCRIMYGENWQTPIQGYICEQF